MADKVTILHAPATPTAIIRDRVSPADLPQFIRAACGEVWSFIRSANLPNPGRHITLYLEAGLVEVGAEVGSEFTGNNRIHSSHLPAGRVATTTHYGPYGRLRDAHSQLRPWCADHGHPLSDIFWEIYGHWEESWNNDPSKIRTDVFHLLADQKA